MNIIAYAYPQSPLGTTYDTFKSNLIRSRRLDDNLCMSNALLNRYKLQHIIKNSIIFAVIHQYGLCKIISILKLLFMCHPFEWHGNWVTKYQTHVHSKLSLCERFRCKCTRLLCWAYEMVHTKNDHPADAFTYCNIFHIDVVKQRQRALALDRLGEFGVVSSVVF